MSVGGNACKYWKAWRRYALILNLRGDKMYIWVAIDVNEQVREIRETAENYMKQQGLSSTTFTMPFHISLKISFQIPEDRIEEVVSDVRGFYRTLRPFQIMVKGIEQAGPIVWLTMQESAELTGIHEKLDKMLFEKYSVIQHEFDKDFLFHTSVLVIDDEEQSGKAFDAIRETNIPKILRAEKFIIGSSAEGRPGTYSVIEEIEL